MPNFRNLPSRIWNAAGFKFIRNRRLAHFPAATFLRRLLRFLDVDCVLDVGANTGQYHDYLRKQVGFEGQIISFEPIPSHVDILHARAKSDPKWTIQGFALGSTPGSMKFNIMGSTQFSSFLAPHHAQLPMFKGANEVQESVDVEVNTLDQTLPILQDRLGLNRLYLKLDTQGFDLEVMKGAVASLSNMRALQTEASVVPLYEGMPDYVATIRAFEARGFVLAGIYPNNPEHFPRLIEFDCYMINENHLPPVAR